MLTISGKALGRKKPLFADWSIPFPPDLGDGGSLTLRDLIGRVVRAEVEAFKKRQQERKLFRALTERQIQEAAGKGKIEMGGSELDQKVDPEGAEYYKMRAALLEKEMESTHIYIHELLQKIPSERRFLVTSHDAFRYFVKSYFMEPGEANWTKRFTAPEGLAPDGQLNPTDIRRAIDFLREHQIQVVFPESNVNRDSVAKIASASRELGFDVQVCKKSLYGDSTGGLPYLEMMRVNAEVISEHLQEP